MIRRAKEKDLPEVDALLEQVKKVHSDGQPDIFTAGGKKYTDEELKEIFRDDSRPVFVYTDEQDKTLGYAFCIFEETKGSPLLIDAKCLYIDDICVDAGHRRMGIAAQLYRHVVEFAKEAGCSRVTLNVWECNKDGQAFYGAMGMRPLKTMMLQQL